MTGGEEMPAVTLARIEGKLDLLHAAIQTAESRGLDHENRIRTLESTAADTARVAAVEARASALELRPIGITPAKFLGGVVAFGSIAAAMASVATVLAR